MNSRRLILVILAFSNYCNGFSTVSDSFLSRVSSTTMINHSNLKQQTSPALRARNRDRYRDTSFAQTLQRSSNTHTSISSHTNSHNHLSKKEEHILSLSYKVSSMTYVTQIIMAFLKSGFKPISANSIGSPVLAAYLTWNLSNKENIREQDVSSKIMNGVLIIYSSLCLSVTAIIPKFNDRLIQLYCITALSTFILSAKGYSRGLPHTGIKGIIQETKALMPRIRNANFYARPRNVSTVFYLICMATVILLKMEQMIPILLDPAMRSPMILAFKMSNLAKLSVLGGSLVTLRDAANEGLLGQTRFRILNIFASYVFGAYTLGTSVSTMKLAILMISALSCLGNSIFASSNKK